MVLGLLVFGPKKLPEIARTLGKAMYQLKNASSNFSQEMSKEWRKIEKEASEGSEGPKEKGGEEAKVADTKN